MTRSRALTKIFGGLVACAVVIVGGASASPPQPLVTRTYSDMTISVFGYVPDYDIQIQRTGLPTAHLSLHALDLIDRIERWNQRAMLIGQSDHLSEVHVIDLTTPSIVDNFLGQRLNVSPDGRYAAYRRADVRADPQSAVYAVYDAALSPDANRMRSGDVGQARLMFAGSAVYPQWNLGARMYSPEPGAIAEHEDRSPVTWLDSTTFAFLDYSAPEIDAVLVSLRQGLSNPEIRKQALDPDDILDRQLMNLPTGIPTGRQLVAAQITPIGSTETTWTFRVKFVSGKYVKKSFIDIEM